MYIKTSLIFCCLILSTNIGFSQNETEAETEGEKQFEAGRKALFQGKYEEAVKALRAAVKADTQTLKSFLSGRVP